jgi:DeoR/GlpR family transcriptional regulator of sugar metabolism
MLTNLFYATGIKRHKLILNMLSSQDSIAVHEITENADIIFLLCDSSKYRKKSYFTLRSSLKN